MALTPRCLYSVQNRVCYAEFRNSGIIEIKLYSFTKPPNDTSSHCFAIKRSVRRKATLASANGEHL